MEAEYDWWIYDANVMSAADGANGYSELVDASIGILDGSIAYLGDKPTHTITAKHQLDAAGRWITPGLIDCHTHLVFGGNRAQEFAWRLQGESYESIAAKGGGIISTVRETRALSEDALFAQSAPRLERLLEEGVTTVEIKSGYGLDIKSELKMLNVARAMGEAYPVTVKTTFLGAHAVPPEYGERVNGKQAYIDYVCNDMLPEVARSGLADAVDVFCEEIAFSPAQCEQVFRKARKLDLPIKGHVEQLSYAGGARLAADYQALSVDHIEYLPNDEAARLADTVAVLLPAAFYCLNETQKPPINALRENQVPMAVATDLNPGTAPMASLLTAMNQACVLFGLTPQESLAGVTVSAAKALGLVNKGKLGEGMDADLVLWDIGEPDELAYGVNFYRPDAVWQAGDLVRSKQGLSDDT